MLSSVRRLAAAAPRRRLPLRSGARAMSIRHSYEVGSAPGVSFAGEPPDSREFVPQLEFLQYPDVPCFRVMETDGSLVDADAEPDVSPELALRMYTSMVELSVMDALLYDAQRQGRLTFYLQSVGEEAACIGSAAALDDDDEVFAQYREQGVLLYRGFTFEQFCHQCLGTRRDPGKGRQMPIHYGSKELGFHTISSPLATQLPQAAGVAYARKLEGRGGAVACYFGDGAASEGDFHAGLNFAATLQCPVVFFCRNNGYAISTPVSEQMVGDGIVSRGPGYGIPAVRVDGNDVLAVYSATKKAREMAVGSSQPVLVEAMSYRVSHHSTSDDSTAYRSQDEMDTWKQDDNPIQRMRLFLEARGQWDSEREETLRAETRTRVLAALKEAEAEQPNGVNELFDDVYDEVPLHLQRQQAALAKHMERNDIS